MLLYFMVSLSMIPHTGSCEENRKVTLVHTDAHRAFFARILAEIQIAGFTVTQTPDNAVPNESEIKTVLRTSCAFVFVQETTQTLEVYYRTTDGRIPHLEMPLPSSSEEEQITSLHIAEVLRVTFVKEQQMQQPPMTPQAPVFTHRVSDDLYARLGAQLLWGDSSAPPQFGLNTAMGIRLKPRIFVALKFNVPIWGTQRRRTEGNARIHMGGLGINLGISGDTGIFRPVVELGYQLWLIRATSEGASGFEGTTSTELISGPVIFGGGTVLIKGRIGITMGGVVAITTHVVEYALASHMAATIGRPIFGISLGISWLPIKKKR